MADMEEALGTLVQGTGEMMKGFGALETGAGAAAENTTKAAANLADGARRLAGGIGDAVGKIGKSDEAELIIAKTKQAQTLAGLENVKNMTFETGHLSKKDFKKLAKGDLETLEDNFKTDGKYTAEERVAYKAKRAEMKEMLKEGNFDIQKFRGHAKEAGTLSCNTGGVEQETAERKI